MNVRVQSNAFIVDADVQIELSLQSREVEQESLIEHGILVAARVSLKITARKKGEGA